MQQLWPLRINETSPRTVQIEWSDGMTTGHSWQRLRGECRCAYCRDEATGQPLLDPAAVPPDIHAANLEVVGNYGLRIVWSDQHSTGIYSFELLRELDEGAQG